MYTVVNGQCVIKFETKEDQVRYFVNQEPFLVLKHNPKEYVPSVFREGQYKPEKDFAMRNSCRSWKEQSKCRKSWQRRSCKPSARKLYEDEWAKYLEEQICPAEEENANLLQAG